MKTANPGSRTETDLSEAEAAFAAFIRRLIQDAATLRAIDSGEVDAILDPVSGRAILLPEAREALRQSEVPTNQVLATLPREEYQRLRAGLELVTLTFGDVLHEPGELIQHIYFPNEGLLVSLLTLVQDLSLIHI